MPSGILKFYDGIFIAAQTLVHDGAVLPFVIGQLLEGFYPDSQCLSCANFDFLKKVRVAACEITHLYSNTFSNDYLKSNITDGIKSNIRVQ